MPPLGLDRVDEFDNTKHINVYERNIYVVRVTDDTLNNLAQIQFRYNVPIAANNINSTTVVLSKCARLVIELTACTPVKIARKISIITNKPCLGCRIFCVFSQNKTTFLEMFSPIRICERARSRSSNSIMRVCLLFRRRNVCYSVIFV